VNTQYSSNQESEPNRNLIVAVAVVVVVAAVDTDYHDPHRCCGSG